jgi:hypothetical protein
VTEILWKHSKNGEELMNNNVSVHLSLTFINSSAYLNILSISSPFEWDCFALQLHSKEKELFLRMLKRPEDESHLHHF